MVLLVNDILELEKLRLGKVKLLPQTCHAADLIYKAKDSIELLANRSGISLSVSAQPIPIYGDCDRIIQVLTNLFKLTGVTFASSINRFFLTINTIEKKLYKIALELI